MYSINEQYKYSSICDEDPAFEETISQLVDHVNAHNLGQHKEACRLNPEKGNESFRNEYGAMLMNFVESKVNRNAVESIRSILKAPIKWPVELGPKPSSEQSYEYQQCLKKIDKLERYILKELIPSLRTAEIRMEHRSEILPSEIEASKQKLVKQFAPELIANLSEEQTLLLRTARKNQRTIWLIRTMQEEYVLAGNERMGVSNDDKYVVALIDLLDEFGYVELEKSDAGNDCYRLTAKGIKAADSCEVRANGLIGDYTPSGQDVVAKSTKPHAEVSSHWSMLHPQIVSVAKGRFESGHYADSVEASLKAVNKRVKDRYRIATGKELDGHGLMTQAFSANNPVIVLDDLSTQSGKDIQQGYMQIFAGSMTGIRNPKAHDNISIDQQRAIHLLYLASLLMFKLDDAMALESSTIANTSE